MPKKVFWPVSLVIMGLIFLASNMGYLPARFWNLWPIILIVVGLGGLLTSDRDEWIEEPKKKTAKKRTTKKRK
ncbi:MAG: LiaI-LiaF-like domain-containing protein [Patescibacteria group bacterium]